ncbi:tripartite tricarboxylate transporter substrate binding protein [Sulfitobacter sp. D35]|uniref:Bug family tripartite tricarboxylate transporter substrate binding protein n=1 Tax=Sulfitobacter sp. D35 TaxID=3083252 RepID=UPI00296FA051|nr:tripartite tricarboxylate transporter substrate binding protein [Sulfitobacter sp. D35]MDW4499334.1 tripartite tricarboxylate transporter substrate binding protein [Sulfitobacter sp. D35]
MKRLIASLACGLALSAGLSGAAQAEYPERPIRVIVPTDAGGSVDAIARVIQRHVENADPLGQNLAVVNQPGAGGTIATRNVKDADPDGYTIGLWHEGLVTSKVMGVVDFDHSDFRILGGTGYTEIGLATGKSNEIKSYEDLASKASANPDTVLVATNVGLAVHFVPLMMEEEGDYKLRYVQTGGGAKRFPSVVAGHTDVAIFGVSEMIKWAEADLNPLVIFSEERVPELPDVPTAREMGMDIVADGHRFWLAPKDTPEEIVTMLTDMLRGAVNDPDSKAELEAAGFRAVFVEPEEAVAVLDTWRSRAEPLLDKVKELNTN